jgi:hypothetical protein
MLKNGTLITGEMAGTDSHLPVRNEDIYGDREVRGYNFIRHY